MLRGSTETLLSIFSAIFIYLSQNIYLRTLEQICFKTNASEILIRFPLKSTQTLFWQKDLLNVIVDQENPLLV